MSSNNLNGVRIADNQTSGQHRTANEALNRIDAAISDGRAASVSNTNTLGLSSNVLQDGFHFVIGNGATNATANVTITFPTGERGVTFWRNTLAYAATLSRFGQTAPAVVIPPGGFALVEFDGVDVRQVNYCEPFYMVVAASDESTAITAGTGKLTFRMPARVWITEVRASLKTAQASGSILTVDINEAGTSVLSTKLTIDNTEKTSTTAATAAVISDPALADDAEITIDIDQVGDGTAKGLKVALIGYRY